MKYALIFIIGALVSLQASQAQHNKFMSLTVFDSDSIFKIIKSAETAGMSVFANPFDLNIKHDLLKIGNDVSSAISSRVDNSIIYLQIVRTNADNMVEAYFLKENSSLVVIVDCLVNSTVDPMDFFDTVRNTSETCITEQYEESVELIESFRKNFTDWMNSTKVDSEEEYNECQTNQNGWFDIIGAFRKWNCLVQVLVKLRQDSVGFFTYVRNTAVEFNKSAPVIPRATYECVKNARQAITDFKRDVLSNCTTVN